MEYLIEFFDFLQQTILANTSGIIENKHLIMFEDPHEALDTAKKIKDYCEAEDICVNSTIHISILVFQIMAVYPDIPVRSCNIKDLHMC